MANRGRVAVTAPSPAQWPAPRLQGQECNCPAPPRLHSVTPAPTHAGHHPRLVCTAENSALPQKWHKRASFACCAGRCTIGRSWLRTPAMLSSGVSRLSSACAVRAPRRCLPAAALCEALGFVTVAVVLCMDGALMTGGGACGSANTRLGSSRAALSARAGRTWAACPRPLLSSPSPLSSALLWPPSAGTVLAQVRGLVGLHAAPRTCCVPCSEQHASTVAVMASAKQLAPGARLSTFGHPQSVRGHQPLEAASCYDHGTYVSYVSSWDLCVIMGPMWYHVSLSPL